jgi:hypothetical protein
MTIGVTPAEELATIDCPHRNHTILDQGDEGKTFGLTGWIDRVQGREPAETVASVVTVPSRASLRTRGVQPSALPLFAFMYSKM